MTDQKQDFIVSQKTLVIFLVLAVLAIFSSLLIKGFFFGGLGSKI